MTAVMFQNMPPLSPEEYAALEASIREHGIQVPIVVDENRVVIDGHHRQKIAQELGIDCPKRVVFDKSDAEKRTLALSLNLDRRHLNREQRRALIAESLVADPELSNRQHAERVGVDHKTVGAVRDDLLAGGEIPHLDTRRGPDGKEYPATQPPVERTVIAEVRHIDIADRTEPVDIDTGEIIEPEPEPRKVTGLDGKTYTPPKGNKPRRTPLPDLFRTQSANLDRVSKQMRALAADDRWAANKTEIAARYGHDLRLAIDALEAIHANLTQ